MEIGMHKLKSMIACGLPASADDFNKEKWFRE